MAYDAGYVRTGAQTLAASDRATFSFNPDGSLKVGGVSGGAMAQPTANARLLSAAASTNATVVKASGGSVYHITGYNANAAARYLKLYNKATAPTVGTDVPVVTEYLAPQAKFSISIPAGLVFSTGIGYGLTTAAADNDTGALTLADILCLNIAYG